MTEINTPETEMKVAVVIGYNKQDSFCYSGIVGTILETLNDNDVDYKLIDLFLDDFHPSGRANVPELIESYQKTLTECTHHIYVSPCWWFRLTSMLEAFIDIVMVPEFAYRFKHLFSVYGMPIPLLKHKRVLTFITHGGPFLAVTFFPYFNLVKWRLQFGVWSFMYGWFNGEIIQFFSVPFISDAKRKKMLDTTKKRIQKEIKRYQKKHK